MLAPVDGTPPAHRHTLPAVVLMAPMQAWATQQDRCLFQWMARRLTRVVLALVHSLPSTTCMHTHAHMPPRPHALCTVACCRLPHCNNTRCTPCKDTRHRHGRQRLTRCYFAPLLPPARLLARAAADGTAKGASFDESNPFFAVAPGGPGTWRTRVELLRPLLRLEAQSSANIHRRTSLWRVHASPDSRTLTHTRRAHTHTSLVVHVHAVHPRSICTLVRSHVNHCPPANHAHRAASLSVATDLLPADTAGASTNPFLRVSDAAQSTPLTGSSPASTCRASLASVARLMLIIIYYYF